MLWRVGCLTDPRRFSKDSNHDKVPRHARSAPKEPTGTAPIKPAELAAYLAARMCHDFISPASAIVSGLDLLEDPTAQDMREDAMGLIADLGARSWRTCWPLPAWPSAPRPRRRPSTPASWRSWPRASSATCAPSSTGRSNARGEQARGPRPAEPRPDRRRGAADRRDRPDPRGRGRRVDRHRHRG